MPCVNMISTVAEWFTRCESFLMASTGFFFHINNGKKHGKHTHK